MAMMSRPSYELPSVILRAIDGWSATTWLTTVLSSA
jgi:hypothetical protein